MVSFDEARRAALMEDLLRLLTGKPVDLLPFDAVREKLKLLNFVDRGVRDVPLNRIVGTVGRAGEFNRAFLPRSEALRERWKNIRWLVDGQKGYPPVELYQVGDVYFVVDGHHRISVAHSLGTPTIEARVKEYLTPISLGPHESLEQVLLKGELADFLQATGLVPQEPDEFRITDPGGYARLLDHISVHRYYLGLEQKREIPWAEAVASWRDTVYRPVIETIRKSGVLEQFPGRTETDLYLFTMDQLHYLREKYSRATATQAIDQVRAAASEPKRGWRGWLHRLRRGS